MQAPLLVTNKIVSKQGSRNSESPKNVKQTTLQKSDSDDIIITTDVNQTQALKVSWSEFRFFQIDETWQRHWCDKLSLPFCCTYTRSIGSSTTILTKPNMQTKKVMLGDGNCLFRSFSYVLTGSQEYHLDVRTLICHHMTTISDLVEQHTHPHSVQQYIAQSKMNNNNVWGTHIEILTFANLCESNVYVFNVQTQHWDIFTPNFRLRGMNVSTQSVYLLHPLAHYDVVTSCQ